MPMLQGYLKTGAAAYPRPTAATWPGAVARSTSHRADWRRRAGSAWSGAAVQPCPDAAERMQAEREAANGTPIRPVASLRQTRQREDIMSDDLNNRHGQDRTRINLNEKWEVDYWTRELGISKEELERAVKMAGDRVASVRQHLGR
jgi:hypothetical protein